jgi:hypothetical protein
MNNNLGSSVFKHLGHKKFKKWKLGYDNVPHIDSHHFINHALLY